MSGLDLASGIREGRAPTTPQLTQSISAEAVLDVGFPQKHKEKGWKCARSETILANGSFFHVFNIISHKSMALNICSTNTEVVFSSASGKNRRVAEKVARRVEIHAKHSLDPDL